MSSKCAIILLIVVALNVSICCNADYVLGIHESLYTGDSLQYNNYVLTMQEDCNLVFYDSGYPIWATNTGGLASGCYCTMQEDGNLVVYSSSNRPVWASNTGGNNGYYVLVLQKDRNLVIYGNPIWHTNTATNGANTAPMFIPKVINANQTDSIIKKVTSTV